MGFTLHTEQGNESTSYLSQNTVGGEGERKKGDPESHKMSGREQEKWETKKGKHMGICEQVLGSPDPTMCPLTLIGTLPQFACIFLPGCVSTPALQRLWSWVEPQPMQWRQGLLYLPIQVNCPVKQTFPKEFKQHPESHNVIFTIQDATWNAMPSRKQNHLSMLQVEITVERYQPQVTQLLELSDKPLKQLL